MSSLIKKTENLNSNINISKKRYSFSLPQTRIPIYPPLFSKDIKNFIDKSHNDYSTEVCTPKPSTHKIHHHHRKSQHINHRINDGIRRDFYGNKIIKGGNQKVTFIDTISHNNLVEVTLIDAENCSCKYNNIENIEENITLCSCNIF